MILTLLCIVNVFLCSPNEVLDGVTIRQKRHKHDTLIPAIFNSVLLHYSFVTSCSFIHNRIYGYTMWNLSCCPVCWCQLLQERWGVPQGPNRSEVCVSYRVHRSHVSCMSFMLLWDVATINILWYEKHGRLVKVYIVDLWYLLRVQLLQLLLLSYVNSFPLDKMATIFVDDIFKCIFMNENFCISISNLTEVCS